MEIIYELSMLTVVRERMALRATEEPMLMRERRTVRMKETMMALRGIFQVGLTWLVVGSSPEGEGGDLLAPARQRMAGPCHGRTTIIVGKRWRQWRCRNR